MPKPKNAALTGVPASDYARPALDATRLGRLIDLIANVRGGERLRVDARRQHGVSPAADRSACP